MRTPHCLYTFALVLTCLFGPIDSKSQTFDFLRTPQNAGMSYGRNAATAPNGDLYQWTIFSDTVIIGTDTLVGAAGFDSFLGKYNSAGTLQWAIEAESFGDFQASSMTLDVNDNAYVAGAHDQTVRWDGALYNVGPGYKVLISKVNSAGVVDWVLEGENGTGATKYYLSYADNGSIYVTGRFNDSISLGSFQRFATDAGIFCARVDTSGTILWMETMEGGNSGFSEPLSIGTDPNGTVFISAMFGDSLYNNTDTLTTEFNSGSCLLLYDDTGSLIHSAGIGFSTGGAPSLRLAVSPVGQLFFSCTVSDTLFLPGDTVVSPTGPAIASSVVFAYDTLVGLGWTRLLASTTNILARDIVASAKGQVYLGGTFTDNMTMGGFSLTDPTPGSVNSFLANIDASGKVEWLEQFGSGVGASSDLEDLHLDGQDRIVGAGSSDGQMSIGPFNANNDNQHYFLVRIADDSIPTDLPVWPGDGDDGFVVSERDLLPIGLAFGSFGPGRPAASLAWVAQPAPMWSDSLKNGVNRAHADMDGSGVVYWDDTLAFTVNFDSVHAKTSIVSTGGIPLQVQFQLDTISESDTIVAVVSLGDSNQVIDSLYGIAFKFKYDPTYVDSGKVWVDYSQSWLGTKNVDMITLDKDNYSTGNVHIGLCRVNQVNSSGAGEICRLTIVMIDDIAGKRSFDFEEQISAQTEDILAITYAEDTLSFASAADSFLLVPVLKPVWGGDPELNVYPNPFTKRCRVEVLGAEGEGIELKDLHGRSLRQWPGPFRNKIIDLENLAAGVYLLEVQVLDRRMCYKLLKE